MGKLCTPRQPHMTVQHCAEKMRVTCRIAKVRIRTHAHTLNKEGYHQANTVLCERSVHVFESADWLEHNLL